MTRCTIWWPPIRCSMRSRSSRPTTPAARASSPARRRKNARRWWSSPGEPSPPRRATTDRSSTAITFALPVPRRGNYAVVGHRRSGEPAPDADPRTAGRARVRRADHRARHAPRPLHGPSAAGTAASRHPADHGGDAGRQSARAGDADPARRARRDRRRGLNEMLDQLERFNQSLQGRIEEATRDLSLRNAQLAASQGELFALRESLGARRARGGAGPGRRQRRPPGRHAAEPRLGLHSDDPRRPEDGRSDPLEAADRRRADSAGHARAADDARPRAAAVRGRRS